MPSSTGYTDSVIWGIVIFVAVLLALFLWQYNSLVYMRQLTRNSWADVDVYLKRRAELVPNLVAAVKAYANHESTLLEALATARSQALSAGDAKQARASAESKLGQNLFQAIIVSENYPALKASENFMNLQRELAETESKIASARQYYNACVRDLNTKVESFPSGLIAGMAGIKHEEFFEVDDPMEREAAQLAM